MPKENSFESKILELEELVRKLEEGGGNSRRIKKYIQKRYLDSKAMQWFIKGNWIGNIRTKGWIGWSV